MSVPPNPAGHGRNPFDLTGVQRGADGVAGYSGLAESLVHRLRASVELAPTAPAVTEVGGETLSYGVLWQRAQNHTTRHSRGNHEGGGEWQR